MKYLSLFSGIGGFEKGIENVAPDWECVGFAEIDKYASAIYRYHYPQHKHYKDVTAINVSELPDFDILVGGFPCQAFSIAGKRQGFKDTRGTLFFDVARILKGKRPEWLLLENVKGLLNHDAGQTVATIFGVLTELGYSVGWEVVNSCHFGVPQNRERIFIVGHLRETGGRAGEILPFGEADKETDNRERQDSRDARERKCIGSTSGRSEEINGGRSGISQTNGSLHNDVCEQSAKSNTVIIAHYGHKDKSPVEHEISPTLKAQDRHGVQINTEIRRLTPKECERLQGFPDDWTKFGIIDGEKKETSDTQRYKTLGNAVTVNVIEAIMRKIKMCT